MKFFNNMIDTFGSIFRNSNEQKNILELNPKFETFKKTSEQDDIAKQNSLIEDYFKDTNNPGMTIGYDANNAYTNFVYGAVSTSKPVRLGNYRRMAQFPEITLAIEEYCDNIINRDENGEFVKLKINNNKLENIQLEEINTEFKNYISLFDLEYNFQDYFRSLVVDGEVAFENIIDKDNKEEGIIGVNFIPTESYDFLINRKGEKEGINVIVQKDKNQGPVGNNVNGGLQTQDLGSYLQKQSQNKQPQDITSDDNINMCNIEGIPLPWEQITYIDTGMYSPNRLIVYPVLEKARKAYRQLSLIEDAIIIYRLVRAPERLVFNVDTGKLGKNKAEQEVLKLMQRFNTKKYYNPLTGSVSNDYDPMQMLENFYFAKPEGSTGTTVNTIGGSVQWQSLPDLEYFQTKLYMALKIPFESRIKDPKIKVENADNISAEEYRFAKFILKLLDRFSIGFAQGFITHLKLKKIWDRLELNIRDLKVVINPPSIYDLYESQRLLKIKMENYDIITKEHEELSKTMAMENILGYSVEQINLNNKRVEEELLRMASIKRKVANIESNGNPNEPIQPS